MIRHHGPSMPVGARKHESIDIQAIRWKGVLPLPHHMLNADDTDHLPAQFRRRNRQSLAAVLASRPWRRRLDNDIR